MRRVSSLVHLAKAAGTLVHAAGLEERRRATAPLGMVEGHAPLPRRRSSVLLFDGPQAGGQGAKMPLAAPSLSDKQIKLFKTWIEQGASRE